MLSENPRFDKTWNPFVLVWPDETPEQAVSRHYSQMQRIGFVVLKFMPSPKPFN
jgi:hypothetical protein